MFFNQAILKRKPFKTRYILWYFRSHEQTQCLKYQKCKIHQQILKMRFWDVSLRWKKRGFSITLKKKAFFYIGRWNKGHKYLKLFYFLEEQWYNKVFSTGKSRSKRLMCSSVRVSFSVRHSVPLYWERAVSSQQLLSTRRMFAVTLSNGEPRFILLEVLVLVDLNKPRYLIWSSRNSLLDQTLSLNKR